MNNRDRDVLDGFSIRLGNVEGGVESILTNHLPSLEKKVDSQDKRIGLLLKIFSIGFAVIGIMLVVLSIIVVAR